MRREESIRFGHEFSGIDFTVTRRGIEVDGFYDSFVGIEGGFIPWEEVDRMRQEVMRVRRKPANPCKTCETKPCVKHGAWCKEKGAGVGKLSTEATK